MDGIHYDGGLDRCGCLLDGPVQGGFSPSALLGGGRMKWMTLLMLVRALVCWFIDA